MIFKQSNGEVTRNVMDSNLRQHSLKTSKDCHLQYNKLPQLNCGCVNFSILSFTLYKKLAYRIRFGELLSVNDLWVRRTSEDFIERLYFLTTHAFQAISPKESRSVCEEISAAGFRTISKLLESLINCYGFDLVKEINSLIPPSYQRYWHSKCAHHKGSSLSKQTLFTMYGSDTA